MTRPLPSDSEAEYSIAIILRPIMQTNVLCSVIYVLVSIMIGLAIFRLENVYPEAAPEEILASVFVGYLLVCLARRSIKAAITLLR